MRFQKLIKKNSLQEIDCNNHQTDYSGNLINSSIPCIRIVKHLTKLSDQPNYQ